MVFINISLNYLQQVVKLLANVTESHFWLALKSHGNCGGFPKTGIKQMSRLCSTRARRKIGKLWACQPTMILEMVVEWVILNTTPKFIKGKWWLGVVRIVSQKGNHTSPLFGLDDLQGFSQLKKIYDSMTNLRIFFDKKTGLVGKGRAVDIVFLDFSKAFNTVSNNVFINKL